MCLFMYVSPCPSVRTSVGDSDVCVASGPTIRGWRLRGYPLVHGTQKTHTGGSGRPDFRFYGQCMGV